MQTFRLIHLVDRVLVKWLVKFLGASWGHSPHSGNTPACVQLAGSAMHISHPCRSMYITYSPTGVSEHKRRVELVLVESGLSPRPIKPYITSMH